MLKQILPRTSGSTAIPGHVTTLSVSWLNSQFKALAVHRGVVEGTWEHTGPVAGVEQFEALIRDAVQQTGYHGQTVSLLVAHPRLAQQLVDAPPAKAPALNKIFQRQAQQQKLFAGEAAWACQPALSGKNEQRVVMHLFPLALLNQFMQGCQRNNLYLTSVVPASAVLHYQLRQLPLDPGDVAVLAAETGSSTTVVIGRSDGQILLARTLSGSWDEEPERLALDLNRTILYVNQQYGVLINSGVWLFGPGAEEHCPVLQRQVQLPVQTSRVEYSPVYWATEVLKLPRAFSPNFISPTRQKAPQRHALARLMVAVTVFVVLASLSLTVFAYYHARQERANINVLTGQIHRLETRHSALEQRNFRLAREDQFASLIIDERPSPVPVWFLGYLSEVVPSELVITNFHIKREEGLWKVQMAGTLQGATLRPAPGTLSNALTLLKTRLSKGPFHVKILSGSDGEKADGTGSKPPGAGDRISEWVSGVAAGILVPEPAGTQFAIEGVMR
jgi:hypothetical protein